MLDVHCGRIEDDPMGPRKGVVPRNRVIVEPRPATNCPDQVSRTARAEEPPVRCSRSGAQRKTD